jgi:hypothetical protein
VMSPAWAAAAQSQLVADTWNDRIQVFSLG